LGRPSIYLLLRIENTHHSKSSKHTDGPSDSGDVVSTVHASVPDGIRIALNFKHLISVKGDVKIAPKIDLVKSCSIVQCQFNPAVLHFAYVGDGTGESGDHRDLYR